MKIVSRAVARDARLRIFEPDENLAFQEYLNDFPPEFAVDAGRLIGLCSERNKAQDLLLSLLLRVEGHAVLTSLGLADVG